MTTTHRFGTAINCIDGRVQEPVARWLRDTYHLRRHKVPLRSAAKPRQDYVDVITEPGADKLLATGSPEALAPVREKVEISTGRHGSTLVAVAGHHDCAANPVTPEEHQEHIRAALRTLRFWNIPTTIIGLWVDDQWQVHEVSG
jgi:hypothetical protein